MGCQRHFSLASPRAKRLCTQCTGNGWASERKTSSPSGFNHRTLQSVASHHYDPRTGNLRVGGVVEIRLRLKCDITRAETGFRLSAKRTSPFKLAGGGGRQFSRLLAPDVYASAVVLLDTPCSEVVWRVLATHSIRQFPLHFPSRASPHAITFQLVSTVS